MRFHSLKEINRQLKVHKPRLQSRFKVREIGVFGSYVRNQQRKRSDVDILIDFEESPDFLTFLELELYLEHILKVKVDMVRKAALRPQLRDRILREVVYV